MSGGWPEEAKTEVLISSQKQKKKLSKNCKNLFEVRKSKYVHDL
jgi:hypothetical protein